MQYLFLLCVKICTFYLQEVVGISCLPSQHALILRLLASGSLLAAIHLLRFGFAVGTIVVRPYCH